VSTLQKLSQCINDGIADSLIIEAKSKIERCYQADALKMKEYNILVQENQALRIENAMFKSALIQIHDLCQQTGKTFEDQSFDATRIAREALLIK
jgi:hypothetical protein